MDKIKTRLINDELTKRGFFIDEDDKSKYGLIEAITEIVDSEYKSAGGVIGEFETWASVYAHDKMYKMSHTTSKFVVQPLEMKD